MDIKTNLANRKNYGDQRQLSSIKYIVIHYTGNDGDSDEANAKYFQGIRNASAHYFVDDDSITQSVPDDYVAWSVGGNKYPDCLSTGGGKWYGKCTNANSISIELCDSVKNGKYDFTENTLKQAAELTLGLMQKYNVPKENVIRHFDVIGKVCPLPMVRDTKQWDSFKARLSAEDKELVAAVKKIIDSGIRINDASWNNILKINLKNVPALLTKLGGINYLVSKKVISNTKIWDKGTYTGQHVRSLLIKYASKIA